MTHPLQTVLLADGASPIHQDKLMLFGQFEGAWKVDVTWFDKGQSTRRATGEWHFGWVLEGRAMQDVWIVPSKGLEGPEDRYEYGTSIRFYDPHIAAWRSTWIGPVQSVVRTFIARQRDDEIVLDGQLPDHRAIEWIFSDISCDRFNWRFQIASGRGWETVQSFACTRL